MTWRDVLRWWLVGRGAEARIRFEGGDGSAAAQAVIVRGARSDAEGRAAQFAWLTRRFGPRGVGWEMIGDIVRDLPGRIIDAVEIQVNDGRTLTVNFDVTDSFGKSAADRLEQLGSLLEGASAERIALRERNASLGERWAAWRRWHRVKNALQTVALHRLGWRGAVRLGVRGFAPLMLLAVGTIPPLIGDPSFVHWRSLASIGVLAAVSIAMGAMWGMALWLCVHWEFRRIERWLASLVVRQGAFKAPFVKPQGPGARRPEDVSHDGMQGGRPRVAETR